MGFMLERLIHVTTSRWAKGIVICLWIVSFLAMFTWVSESWESFPGGGYEHRRNYFEIKRTTLFVWLTLIVLSYIAYKFKQRSLGYYGLFEILFGFVGGLVAVSKLPLTGLSAWLALAASAFVIIRGYGDIVDAVGKADAA